MNHSSSIPVALILTLGIATISARPLSGQQVVPAPPVIQSDSGAVVSGQSQGVTPNALTPPRTNGMNTKTIYKIQERIIRVYNPAVGRYENRTITERVPVETSLPTPGGQPAPPPPSNSQMILTVMNQGDTPIDFYLGKVRRRLNPKSVSRLAVTPGQRYGYSRPAREVSPGRWVGGGTFRGVIKPNQTMIRIGSPKTAASPAPAPPVPTPPASAVVPPPSDDSVILPQETTVPEAPSPSTGQVTY